MNLKIIFYMIVLTIITVLTFSCSTTKTSIIGEWKEETYQKGNIQKVLILGIFNKEKPLLRRQFEQGMSDAFSAEGVTAIQSMDYMPYDEVVDSTDFEKYFKDMNIDAVLVSRLVGVTQEKDYKAGYLYTVPFNNYYGFYGYYYAGISYANSSGYLSKNVVVLLETNIYETKNKKLIWSGVSETIDPDKVSDVIRSFGDELITKLIFEGYFKKS